VLGFTPTLGQVRVATVVVRKRSRIVVHNKHEKQYKHAMPFGMVAG
jgi:hypothetical protein